MDAYFLLLIISLLTVFLELHARILLLSEYPRHIGGRCPTSFDCNPTGSLFCVPFSAVRDCIVDCPNGADEECPTGTVLCDSKLRRGCGKCVKPEDRDKQCSELRWRNICSEPIHFKCTLTDNCVLPQWIGDGADDCADGSDEDPCAVGLLSCNETKVRSMASPFDVATPTKRKLRGGCSGGEFQCITSHECISIAHVLDGIEHCDDGSDERYCKEMVGNGICQKQEQCSFNPNTGMFTCHCPLGYERSFSGICTPFFAPAFSYDCADLQRRFHLAPSNKYILSDWSCSKPELCNFTARCEMDIYGGGWTIIMQRVNTSLSFDKDIMEYKNGFEIDQSNFWIGLERMYRLTNRPQCPNELLLRLRTAEGQVILVRYSHFVVCEKFLDYRLNIGSIVYGKDLNTADEMMEGQMCPFLTSSEKKCEEGGGWWRKRCQQKGVLTATNRATETYPGLTWNGKRLSAVQMLIRPRGYIPPSKE